MRTTSTTSLIASVILAGSIGLASRHSGNAQATAATNAADMKTLVMPVEGMSCVACAARVKQALKDIDGVADVEVNLADRNARVRFAPSKVSPDRLVAAVNRLGYRAGPPAALR